MYISEKIYIDKIYDSILIIVLTFNDVDSLENYRS